MPAIEIDEYEIMYSSNSFSPRIALKANGKYVGQLIFKPNDAQLPADKISGNQVQLHYHLADYPNLIDLLRDESPIYLFYNGSGTGFENGVKTTQEPIGEGEPQ